MGLGSVLKQRRIALGWSVDEAAANVGITASYLYKLEVNLRVPTLEKLRYIAMAYDMPMWVFLYFADDSVAVGPSMAKRYREMKTSIHTTLKEFL